MTENNKRYRAIPANLKCSNGKEYTLVRRDDGFNVCQVCSKHTAREIVDELNNLYEENTDVFHSINNRIHFYKEWQNSTNDKKFRLILDRIVEDLEDLRRLKK